MAAIDGLLAAVDAERVVQFSYPSSEDGTPVRRTFSPWEPHGASILGWDHDRERPRHYRPERITGEVAVDPLESYTHPT